MATPSDSESITATLSTTTVDTVTITRDYRYAEVMNRTGSADLTITYGVGQAASPATPVADASGTIAVPPGTSLQLRLPGGENSNGFVVKVLGNSNKYSVRGCVD